MATYGKYFSAATITTGTTSFTNLFNAVSSDRRWSDLVNLVASKLFVLDSSNLTRLPGPAIPIISKSHPVPMAILSGTITATIIFKNTGNQTRTSYVSITFSDHKPTASPTFEDITYDLVNTWGDYCANEAYFTNISVNLTFDFCQAKAPGMKSKDFLKLSNGNNLTVNGQTSFTLSRNQSSTRGFNLTMTVVNATITPSTTNRTIRDLSTGGTAFYLNTTLYYTIYPLFLEDRMAADYAKGKPYDDSSQTIKAQLNHQDFMGSSGATSVIQGLISSYTRSGTQNQSNTYVTVNLIYYLVDDGASYTNTQHSFIWTATGYDFYRDTAQTQNITSNNKFNAYNTSTLNLYPKAITETCYETVYMVLYDEDEGDISYDGDKYHVPPTDVITQRSTNLPTLAQKTAGTYRFGWNDSAGGPGFCVRYNNQYYYPLTEIGSGTYYVTATANAPSIARVQFTSHGENLPDTPIGWITHSCENLVKVNNVTYACSVRYHLTGTRSIEYFPKTGSSTKYRTSYYYLAAKKNTLDFINNMTVERPHTDFGYWSDTINGITYTYPIAYANKVSTMGDLFDKMAVYHGKAIYNWLGDDDYISFSAIKEYLSDFFWNVFEGYYQDGSTYNPILYRSITIGGRTYSELNWPMRWYNYPTWTTATQTSFTYYGGLVMKYPPTWTSYASYSANTVCIFTTITANKWNSALTVNQSVTSGVFIITNYNGYIRFYTGGSYPFSTIYANSNSDWNRDRRSIGNYVNDYNDHPWDKQAYLFAPTDLIYEIIEGKWQYFDDYAEYESQRYISYTGMEWEEHDQGGIFCDMKNRQATNDILYTIRQRGIPGIEP